MLRKSMQNQNPVKPEIMMFTSTKSQNENSPKKQQLRQSKEEQKEIPPAIFP
jgi:hypothetical protein